MVNTLIYTGLKENLNFHNIYYPVYIYLFKVNNRNTRKRCEICSKLTIKTPDGWIIRMDYICQQSHFMKKISHYKLSKRCPCRCFHPKNLQLF